MIIQIGVQYLSRQCGGSHFAARNKG